MTSTSPLSARPGKIIAVHLNYRSRAAQRGRTPAVPSYFLKPATSVAASGEALERPAGTELLGFEGEIALVIGERARRVGPAEGWSYVSGVTAANDFGVYDLRYADKGANLRSKGGDGFTPLGPSVLPAAQVDPADLRIRTWVNGELVQEDTTAELLFDFGQLVADLSQLITLEPGDVILTGTPAGASVVRPGDVVEVEVDTAGQSTGRLVTPIVDGTVPFGPYGALPRVDDQQRADAYGTTESFVLTEELRERITSVGVATLSAQLRKRGYNNVSIDGLTSTKPGQKLVGRARTLRYIPHREDLFREYGGGYNAQKRAFDSLEPGDVLVMEARGERGTGTVGDILALRAQVRGAAGIVTDGGVRDVAAVAALDIPTYHAGPHPAVLGRRHVPWDVDVTVACGGASVQPGDVIVGDADGLLVIPPHLVEEVVAGAIEQERQESFIAEQVAAGARVDGLYPMDDSWKARYAEWQPKA
ncbi:fumarylacetoacetate hydrolase family protein [Actinocrispum wychmicini]|uniref:2-keto-4-pentenoate hydratase/2-oxohepta-3-ene-1,7-dioic acid hydratase in catechol pathway n=1 Tax=Actinocrispum wychmicini TaxID=1213861 RepID=A0A4R2JL16_9PSEU|nr:fumarylacetoacetate hydrolase family protein [Actinocrispum wychmicini]TCO59864.1 2-keto-4-pentenoate hydratase/2-oxohepta-3-ene-1,7-dioic acid hydratase in catechol pathway [Actinocrispum wychmicini]